MRYLRLIVAIMIEGHPLTSIQPQWKTLTLHLGKFTGFFLQLAGREIKSHPLYFPLSIEVIVYGVCFALAVLICHIGLGRV